MVVASSLAFVSSVSAQYQRIVGSNALVYKLPWITIDPPVYPGQPKAVSDAYQFFDKELRQSKLNATDDFFKKMGYGDTSKYFMNAIYRVDDDNPLSFFSYKTEPNVNYITGPNYAFISFCNNISRMYNDSGITDVLVYSDIISDIRVTDTARKLDALTPTNPLRMVAVTCQILDEIKGKMVPACPSEYLGGKISVHPHSTAPFLTSAVQADTGGCLQFQYSLDWHYYNAGFAHKFGDSVNGDWIRKDSEYIVFLSLSYLTSDTAHHYCFTISPSVVVWGSCMGMYPVRNGLVYDPLNDFGFGYGLTPDEFKSKLRARINNLLHP
jgi:hypothetical protein